MKLISLSNFSFLNAPPTALRGAGFMLAATISNAFMIAGVHHLTEELHPFVIGFFRSLVGFLLFSPLLIRYGLKPLRTRRLGLHVVRCVFNVASMMTFFTALGLAPLAKVVALNFVAPLFSTFLAFIVLREAIRIRRLAALVVGFIGTLVILRPGVVELDTGSMVILISAALWGITMIIIKILSRTESSLTTTLYLSLFMTPLSFLAAPTVWQTPTWEQLLWLAGIGTFGTFSNFTMAQAFREADATIVLPFDFTKLIWASFIGYFVFGEILDFWTWVGATIIIVAVTYIAYRESRAKQLPPSKFFPGNSV